MILIVFRTFIKGLLNNAGFTFIWNLAILALFFLGKFLIGMFSITPAVLAIMLGLTVLISFWLAIGSRFAADLVRGEKSEWKNFLPHLKASVFDGFILLLIFLLLFITLSSLAFYWTDENLLSKISFVVLMAGTVVGAVILQFYLTIRIQEKVGFRDALRLGITFVADSPVFSLLVGLFSFVLLVLTMVCIVVSLSLLSSAPLMMMLPTCLPLAMFPGFFGLMIFSHAAFALRCKRYSWLEAHPEAQKSKLPWKEILADEIQKLNQSRPRTLNRRL